LRLASRMQTADFRLTMSNKPRRSAGSWANSCTTTSVFKQNLAMQLSVSDISDSILFMGRVMTHFVIGPCMHTGGKTRHA